MKADMDSSSSIVLSTIFLFFSMLGMVDFGKPWKQHLPISLRTVNFFYLIDMLSYDAKLLI